MTTILIIATVLSLGSGWMFYRIALMSREETRKAWRSVHKWRCIAEDWRALTYEAIARWLDMPTERVAELLHDIDFNQVDDLMKRLQQKETEMQDESVHSCAQKGRQR